METISPGQIREPDISIIFPTSNVPIEPELSAFGPIAFGSIAFGSIAFGPIAFGPIAFGPIAFGPIAFGSIASFIAIVSSSLNSS